MFRSDEIKGRETVVQVEMDTRGCVVEGGFSGWMGCRAVTGERQARRFAENRRQAEPDGSRIIICSLNALSVQFISVCFAFVSHDLAPFNVFQRGSTAARGRWRWWQKVSDR